jgi:hypothetical protein
MPSDERRDQADAESARAVSQRPSEGERKKKTKRPKAPIPRTEREIDAPDRVTLLMLGVMGFMTIVLWAFAKGGCNYHPPRETRRPRPVKTEELARDPKDAALEMQQRFVQYDFDGALELSADAAETQVKQRKAECAGKVKECAENKKKNERTATTAVLLERDMGSAVVRATSATPPSGKLANILKLERRGPTWKVVSFAADDGSYKPKPPEPMQLVPGSMMQAVPAASGAASATPEPKAKKTGTPSVTTPKPATPVAAPAAAAPAASK